MKEHLLFVCILLSIISPVATAANCDSFFYTGEPIRVAQYEVSYVKKNLPDFYFPDLARPIPLTSDLLIQWSDHAAACLFNPNNGVFASAAVQSSLDQLKKLLAVRTELQSIYAGDSLYENRRVNKLLKQNFLTLQNRIDSVDALKVTMIRDLTVSTCQNFSEVQTQLDRILSLTIPIKARSQYVRNFCQLNDQQDRAAFLLKMEQITSECEQGNTESCDLLDIYDYVDCADVEKYLASNFDGLMDRFGLMKSKLQVLKKECADYLSDILTTGRSLGLNDTVSKIPDPNHQICKNIGLDESFCLVK